MARYVKRKKDGQIFLLTPRLAQALKAPKKVSGFKLLPKGSKPPADAPFKMHHEDEAERRAKEAAERAEREILRKQAQDAAGHNLEEVDVENLDDLGPTPGVAPADATPEVATNPEGEPKPLSRSALDALNKQQLIAYARDRFNIVLAEDMTRKDMVDTLAPN